MRVISGKARRLLLEVPEGLKIRPTTDRIKETVFNILQNDIEGTRFLDLFAGSGSMGIEALSRGAARAYFVDNSKEAIECINRNIKHTGFIKESRVLQMDYSMALRRLATWGDKFDIIFIDPPYETDYEYDILKEIDGKNLLNDYGIIIIETKLKKDLVDLEKYNFKIYREKKYKTNKHYFIRKREE